MALIEKAQAEKLRGWGGRFYAAINIILNLLILGVFKYYNFFLDNLEHFLNNFGIQLDWPTLNIILPVGISFYTFQALSYTIDVYRKKINATHDVVEFFAFISFFPQLVAGPIERATNLLPQFQKERKFDYESAVDGCRQMLWGFLKKLVVADNCALAVNSYWDSYQTLPGFTLFILGFLFTMQIYCDFSGYSDIAIGCARLFGINLMDNFKFPYYSRSIPEFWRRWHISLTTWFRDYIYFPLGGSLGPKWKTIRNVFIVWCVSGLWHGANWTFVCWGLFHATLLAIYNILGINTKYNNVVANGKLLPNVKEFFQITITFFLAIVGWIIFRANTLSEAWGFIYRMFTTFNDNIDFSIGKRALVYGLILFVVEWFQRDKRHALQLENKLFVKYPITRYILYALITIIIFLYSGTVQTFIYFQF